MAVQGNEHVPHVDRLEAAVRALEVARDALLRVDVRIWSKIAIEHPDLMHDRQEAVAAVQAAEAALLECVD